MGKANVMANTRNIYNPVIAEFGNTWTKEIQYNILQLQIIYIQR